MKKLLTIIILLMTTITLAQNIDLIRGDKYSTRADQALSDLLNQDGYIRLRQVRVGDLQYWILVDNVGRQIQINDGVSADYGRVYNTTGTTFVTSTLCVAGAPIALSVGGFGGSWATIACDGTITGGGGGACVCPILDVTNYAHNTTANQPFTITDGEGLNINNNPGFGQVGGWALDINMNVPVLANLQNYTGALISLVDQASNAGATVYGLWIDNTTAFPQTQWGAWIGNNWDVGLYTHSPIYADNASITTWGADMYARVNGGAGGNILAEANLDVQGYINNGAVNVPVLINEAQGFRIGGATTPNTATTFLIDQIISAAGGGTINVQYLHPGLPIVAVGDIINLLNIDASNSSIDTGGVVNSLFFPNTVARASLQIAEYISLNYDYGILSYSGVGLVNTWFDINGSTYIYNSNAGAGGEVHVTDADGIIYNDGATNAFFLKANGYEVRRGGMLGTSGNWIDHQPTISTIASGATINVYSITPQLPMLQTNDTINVYYVYPTVGADSAGGALNLFSFHAITARAMTSTILNFGGATGYDYLWYYDANNYATNAAVLATSLGFANGSGVLNATGINLSAALYLYNSTADTPVHVTDPDGLQINSTGANGTCDAAHRGAMRWIQGGAGVADILNYCCKSAAGDAYVWSTLTAGVCV